MEKELKPFDRVLTRDYDVEVWVCDLFSHKEPGSLRSLPLDKEQREVEYVCLGGTYKQCIPYEGNEHLLGTADSPEQKRWRADLHELYYFVSDGLNIRSIHDERNALNDRHYKIGNYFRTESEAEAMLEKIKAVFNGGIITE